MKLIPLTRGYFAQVDDEDFDYINQWKWFAQKTGNTIYAQRSVRLNTDKVKGILMHRIILNTAQGLLTDHIDGNGLNNQRNNLRQCTNSQNQFNRKSRPNTASKYKGVIHAVSKTKYFNKTQQKIIINEYPQWRSNIIINGKRIFLGVFQDEKSAAAAYDVAAVKYHGEFANLNFPTHVNM